MGYGGHFTTIVASGIDPGYNVLRTQMKDDLKSLGINAHVDGAPEYCSLVVFDSQEDMNLYRSSGKYGQQMYIRFVLNNRND